MHKIILDISLYAIQCIYKTDRKFKFVSNNVSFISCLFYNTVLFLIVD